MAWRKALAPATGPCGWAWMPPPEPMTISGPRSLTTWGTIFGVMPPLGMGNVGFKLYRGKLRFWATRWNFSGSTGALP